MRILITNDDGIHSPGLEACEAIAKAISDDVWVVAPEFDNSGVSHSLSLNDPLRLRKVGERHYAVKGTPTDCVIMGAYHILNDKKPDLILSGVNRGRNAAEDILYSGTVAGAKEAAVIGIPSFALSQCYSAESKGNPPYETAEKFGPDVIRKVLEKGMPPDVLVNVNFPACQPDHVKGIEVVHMGKRDPGMLRIDARHDGRGNPYYWIAFARDGKKDWKDGTDLFALHEGYVTITPLRLNMTDEPFKKVLEDMFDASASAPARKAG